MLRGRVLKSTGSWYLVSSDEGKKIECRARGGLRLKTQLRATNPISVGDLVNVSLENENQGIIESVCDRTNYLIRKSTNLSKEVHVLAANLDLLFIIVSLKSPKVPLRFLDRVLVSAEAYNIPPAIIINKTDLLESEGEKQHLSETKGLYEGIGYSVYEICAHVESDVTPLKALLENKITAFAGFSGVGKSTLLNSLSPGLGLKTAEVSQSSQKGKHTTTFAEMFEISPGSFIIDTPGIKSLGVIGIEDQELSHFFPEMETLLHDCKFNNCIHVNEPGCAIKKALDSGLVSIPRYLSYLNILEGNDTYR